MGEKDNLVYSIFKDSRGEIQRCAIGKNKFNILLTKKGVMRSGDFHPNTQFDLILKGEFEIILRKNNKNQKIKKGANEFIAIPPNTPHLFKSLTDTVMLEWWDGKFSAQYYQPFRSLIEKQLSKRQKNK